jgi:hypothetical protein
LLGAVTGKLFKVNMPKYVILLIIVLSPLLNLMEFYCLDQSPWNHVGVSDSKDKTNNDDENTNEDEIDEVAMTEIELDPSVNSDHEQELTIESDSENKDKYDSTKVKNIKEILYAQQSKCYSGTGSFFYWLVLPSDFFR